MTAMLDALHEARFVFDSINCSHVDDEDVYMLSRPNRISAYTCVQSNCNSTEMPQSCSTRQDTVEDILCEHLKSVEVNDGSDDTHFVGSCTPPHANGVIIRSAFAQDADGDTLLHSAIITLQQQIAFELISIAPSCRWLDITNGLKQTPLHLAVLTVQHSVVRRLVVGGANITARDREGNTALHIACREGHAAIAKALTEPVRYLETKQNSYDIPYQRIPQDLHVVNYEGLTALHLAAMHGHIDTVKLLIDKQVDINCQDVKSGRTVLHFACENGNLEMVRLLLKSKCCDINARTYNDLTPFDMARDRGHSKIAFELAVAGANLADERDMDEI